MGLRVRRRHFRLIVRVAVVVVAMVAAVGAGLVLFGTRDLDEALDEAVVDYEETVADNVTESRRVGERLLKELALRGDGYDRGKSALERMTSRVEDIMYVTATDWKFARTGFYLHLDPMTGLVTLPAGTHPDYLGKTAQELGIDLGALQARKAGETFVLSIGGVSHCARLMRSRGRLVLAALPWVDVWSWLWVSLATVAGLLTLLATWFTRMVIRMRDDADRIARLHAAVEKRRAADMRMAASIQSNALPRTFPPFPEIADRLDVYAMMEPAKEVGGDFYDIRRLGATKVQITVADVSGKGVPGAMFMMRAKATLANCVNGRAELSKAVDEANRILCGGTEDGLFVTAWIAIVDFVTGRIEYVNAGHNPPLVRRADGRTEWLASADPDLPLAALPDYRFTVSKASIAAGDILFVYSDGVTEANDPVGRLYGEKPLEAVIAAAGSVSAKEACLAVGMSLCGFVSGAEQSDDITMLALGLRAAQPAAASGHRLFGRRISVGSGQVQRRTFPAEDASVPASAAFLAKACPGPDAAVIIDEIVSNIVRCSGATSFTVEVRGDRELTISDDGKPFNPLAVAKPDVDAPAESRKVGGLGVFIVRELAESVAYERRGDRNVLTIRLPAAEKK